MTDQEFESLLRLGHETNGVEFKGPGRRSDPAFLAAVARAIIGMANRRDGGYVIIGVESDSLDPVGLEDHQAATWAYDKLVEAVNEYASPSVSLDLTVQLHGGRKFIVIHIQEFADIPILCRKDYHRTDRKKEPPILRRGGCYVRSRHKPETAEVRSEEEMRELLELAIDKGVRKFVERAQKAGLFSSLHTPQTVSTDDEAFRKQIEDLG